MNTKITVSMVAAAVVAISVAFVPASADERDEAAAPVQGTAVAAAETPQEAIWDMTYGAERPVLVASVDGTAAQEEETVDLSMG
jgi:guanyl-specific ribonuclease Sa